MAGCWEATFCENRGRHGLPGAAPIRHHWATWEAHIGMKHAAASLWTINTLSAPSWSIYYGPIRQQIAQALAFYPSTSKPPTPTQSTLVPADSIAHDVWFLGGQGQTACRTLSKVQSQLECLAYQLSFGELSDAATRPASNDIYFCSRRFRSYYSAWSISYSIWSRRY